MALPHLKRVKYLFSPPRKKSQYSNVILVRDDGTVIRLHRRVTLETLEAAKALANGIKDFEELRGRIESLLPKAELDPDVTESSPGSKGH